MNQYCFTLRVRADRVDEYKQRHEKVWPDMLDALRSAGWSNYSLFLTEDGLLIGYVESDDLVAAQAAMALTDVNRRWQESMAPFFEGLDGGHPDANFRLVRQVFNLDKQLSAASTADQGSSPGAVGRFSPEGGAAP